MIFKQEGKINITFLVWMFLNLVVLTRFVSAENLSPDSQIRTEGSGMMSRVAPGETLPISVKLLNFGLEKKADVTISYQVYNEAGVQVLRQTETVAVETTASFLKNIPIPHNFSPGRYTINSSIVYSGQIAPAISSYQFTVERKIFGIFQTQLILYGIILLFVVLIVAFVTKLLLKTKTRSILQHDYSEVDHKERIYYEMISDVITQMRLQVGIKAIKLASLIDGLELDMESGKIKKLSKNPAEILSLLVLSYEKNYGRKIDLTPEESATKDPNASQIAQLAKYFPATTAPVDANSKLIEKYFSKK